MHKSLRKKLQIYVRRLHLPITIGANDVTSAPMCLRDATACLIAMTVTRWVQEVNMLNQVDTLKPESGQSSIKINLRYFLSINFKR